jgi:GWxTD domain-containing protein
MWPLCLIAVFGTLVISLGTGCSGSEYLLTQTGASTYDFESQPLHPQYYIYHHEDDSTTLHFRISASEILYMRKSPDDDFEATITFKTRLYTPDDSAILIDSLSFDRVSVRTADSPASFSGTIVFPSKSGANYLLEVDCTDESRSATQTQSMRINKSSVYHRQNYLVYEETSSAPLYGYDIEQGTAICVINERLDTNRLTLYPVTNEQRLPAPPFSDNRRTQPEIDNADGLAFNAEAGVVCFDVIKGQYYFSHDPTQEHGVLISTHDEYFPQIKTAEKLAETMRYITSRSEYETINQEIDRKLKVENFWIDCAGSKDRARDLIRIYYGRVTEANYYFSDVLPGWKTDRGLVHIVYGNPKRIYEHENYETWLYGEEDNLNSLSFTFDRKNNPLSDNDFELRRDLVYKTSWERAITSWRNGKIYTD